VTLTPAVGADVLPERPGLSEARRRLLTTAVELFGEQGYHGVSVRDIATEMGLQAAGIYSHVASKQDLLFEVIVIGHEEHRDTISRAVLDADDDAFDQLRALTFAHVMVHLQYPKLARICAQDARILPDAQRHQVLAIKAMSERVFLDVIERGVQRKQFNVDNPQLCVRAIGGMGVRAADWWAPTLMAAEEVARTYVGYAVKIVS
jgi:AcrR family transcriptional regulator